ncbi:hypothetical protein V6N11_038456 [Hibiscus sabdariffa]|uniref:Uncharacterized protein n=1 Tax=Hibiscus sabdariffa TaxID=183260 RepID=A0ABR2SKY9_9ROSI
MVMPGHREASLQKEPNRYVPTAWRLVHRCGSQYWQILWEQLGQQLGCLESLHRSIFAEDVATAVEVMIQLRCAWVRTAWSG